MSTGYPVTLRVTGRRCVVVGGGAVATRRIGILTRAGAEVTVVAPDVSEEIEQLVGAGGVTLDRRPFEPTDLDEAFLALAATDSWQVNHAVAEAAAGRGVLVNVADDPAVSDFALPALVRRRDVTLAISTGGRSPAFARFMREELQRWLTDARCTLLELVADVRRDLRSAGKQLDSASWRRAIDDEQVSAAIAAGDREGARRRLFEALIGGR
jgi:siroheme synthase-like protein